MAFIENARTFRLGPVYCMKQLFTCLLCLALLGLVSSCNKGPTNGIPFYLAMNWGHVNSSASNISVGDTTSFISDVWVQTATTNLGAYQLYCNFPVLQEGKVYFIVNAGVWESGQQEVRVPYPFYAPDTFTIDATPGQKYFHHPVFSYLPAATITCQENFENGTVYDSMHLVFSPDTNVRYGTRCGAITLTATDSDIVSTVLNPSLTSGTAFTVSTGQEAWLELDYKSQVPFWIGVVGVYSAAKAPAARFYLLCPLPPGPNYM